MFVYVLDTHALLWFLVGSPRLGVRAEQAMSSPDSQLILPAIALAEALWIADSRNIGLDATAIITAVESDPRIFVHPLTDDVVVEAHALTSISEMHDRQIVATARKIDEQGQATMLLTKDANIQGSGVVRTDW